MLWCLTALATDLWIGPGMPYTDLSSAAAAASSGDRLLLLPGVYEASGSSADGLTVVGVRGAAVTEVHRAIPGVALLTGDGDTFTLRRLTLDGRGDSPVVVVSGGSTLAVHESRLVDGRSSLSGACIESRQSTTTLTGSLIQGCEADSHAGVYSAFGSIEVSNTVFRENQGSSGGGLTCLDSGCTVTQSFFDNNQAVRGGGLMIWGTDGSVTRSVFCENLATAEGGAIRVRNANPLLAGLVLIDNEATFSGGQISVAAIGGPSFASLEHLTLLGGSIANTEGAGVQVEDQTVVSLDNNLFGNHSGSVDVFIEPGGTVDFGTNWTWGNSAGGTNGPGSLSSMDAELVDDSAGCEPSSWTLSASSAAGGAAAGTDLGATGGSTPLIDADGDGHFPPWDCDDGDASVFPGAAEICNDRDDDCDFEVDEGAPLSDHFRDLDGDGHGAGTPIALCESFWDLVADGDDCDDGNGNINPDAAEVCNGLDEDCDGEIDEGLALLSYWPDADGDGFGAPGTPVLACSAPPGHVGNDTDCDDGTGAVFPGAPELCDGLDQNCDGSIDEDAVDAIPYWLDEDLDGFGDPAQEIVECVPLPGYVLNDEDCDDDNEAVSPNADELCNGVDDDCDGEIDEEPVDGEPRFADLDGDGFGDPDAVRDVCPESPLGVLNATDCDDTRADVNPDEEEIPGNAVDEDCDGVIEVSYSDDPVGEPVERRAFCGCSSQDSEMGWLALGAALLARR